MKILDYKNRDMTNTLLYYGVEDMNTLDEESIQMIDDHSYKARKNHKAPSGGHHIFCKDLVTLYNLDIEIFKTMNKNFRNVQYIMLDGSILWLYCLNDMALNKFTFIGNKVDIRVAHELLTNNGYKLAAVLNLLNDNYSCIYYNVERLMMVKIDFTHGIDPLLDIRIFYRPCDRLTVSKHRYTGSIFRRDAVIRVPFILSAEAHGYDSRLDALFVVPMPEAHKQIFACSNYHSFYSYSDIDTRFTLNVDKSNMSEMMKVLFSKR